MNSRLRILRKELNLTQEALAKKLGIGKSALSMIETGKASLSERNKNIIIQELNINPDWIETGKGEIFNRISPSSTWSKSTDTFLRSQSVPLYDVDATAGLTPLFHDKNSFVPIDYIHIPNLPRCDGGIYIVGDSMYPLLKSGDIVLYKQVHDINNIFWGDMYLLSLEVEGEEYIMVKYIQKSDRDGYVKLVSQNPHHADKDVEIRKIRALALIKASIRMNTLR